MIWPVLRLVWESRGYKLEAVAEDLTKQFGDGFSAANLTRLTKKTKEEVPERVAEFILSRPVLQDSEERAEVVRSGLAALEGRSTVDAAALAAELAARLPQTDPEVIAAAIVAKLQADPDVIARTLLMRFQTDEIASRLADAFATLPTGRGSSLGRLARRVARLVAKRSARANEAVIRKLGTLQATLNHADAMLDVLDARIDRADIHRERDKLEIIRTVRSTGVVAVAAIAILVRCPHVPTPTAQSLRDAFGSIGTGSIGEAKKDHERTPTADDVCPYSVRSPAIDARLGERRVGRPMPHKPLPNQAKAPCRGSETTLYGSCWIKVADQMAPCPPDLYQEGQFCYVPVAENSTLPVGEDSSRRGAGPD